MSKEKGILKPLYPEYNYSYDEFVTPMTDVDGKPVLDDDGNKIMYTPYEAQIYAFRSVYKTGSIICEKVPHMDGFVEFKASIYGSSTDEHPIAVAYEELQRSDDIYRTAASAQAIAVSKALLFAGFGIEAKLEAKMRQKGFVVLGDNPDNKNRMSRNSQDSYMSNEKPEDVIKPPTRVELPKVLDREDPFAANGVLPSIERTKKKSEVKDSKKELVLEKSVDNEEKGNEAELKENTDSNEHSNERFAEDRDLVALDANKAEEKKESDSDESDKSEEHVEEDNATCNDDSKDAEAIDLNKANTNKGVESCEPISNPGEVVITEENSNDAGDLEVYVGKKVSDIKPKTLQMIVRYMKDDIKPELYESMKAYYEATKNNRR